jgi:hypothetical protein
MPCCGQTCPIRRMGLTCWHALPQGSSLLLTDVSLAPEVPLTGVGAVLGAATTEVLTRRLQGALPTHLGLCASGPRRATCPQFWACSRNIRTLQIKACTTCSKEARWITVWLRCWGAIVCWRLAAQAL